MIEHYCYSEDRDEYIQKLKDADYLLTSLVPLDSGMMAEAAQLKAVSVTQPDVKRLTVKLRQDLESVFIMSTITVVRKSRFIQCLWFLLC